MLKMRQFHCPNFDKLDLKRFYQDLPKYMSYLSACALDNW